MSLSDTDIDQSGLLGNEPPLISTGRRMPDKRQVSLRWLAGTILTGLTSVVLMGGALIAALDGRQQLALPAQAYEFASADPRVDNKVIKAGRPGLSLAVQKTDPNIMMVSTVSQEGDRNVVKVRPFLNIEAPLATAPSSEFQYPAFDALAVFSESGEPELVSAVSDQIYGAEVESEVTITLTEFSPDDPKVANTPRQRIIDIEEQIRAMAPSLDAGSTTVASLAFFDTSRFSINADLAEADPEVTVTAENVTTLLKARPADYKGLRYEERVVKVRTEAELSVILTAEGMDEAEAELLEKVLSSDLGSKNLISEDRIRIAYEIQSSEADINTIRPSRISIYRGGAHLVSIARTDKNKFVYAPAPDPIPQIANATADSPVILSNRLPTTYDAIYRSALSQGLPVDLVNKLIRIFSFDVDFNSRISPTDSLTIFASIEDGKNKPTDASEILFAAIQLGNVERRFYRFRDPNTGKVDFYDETGKSAKKFLLRQPVPNGRFRSPFGMRFHPILKYRKMHWGVDWAAPRGTPILSAGNGTVVSAGWNRGYGRQTIVRHANGYVTSYSHQSKIASDVAPGAQVRQGQVIGYVGSTGLSTGPHLHYEVIVNGTKVDPMRIRLPKGRVLEGQELVSFQSERDRIDDLLRDEEEETRFARF